MLIPGIKIGQHDWQDKIAAKPKFAEIWYRVDQAIKYTPILTAFQSQNIPFGLHFWAVTATGHEPNIAYPGKNLIETTALIRDCIEQASSWQASYVNIHSGNRSLMHINFEAETMMVDATFPTISDTQAVATRSRVLTELGSYAHQCNVALLVEAIPAKVAGSGWHSTTARMHPVDQSSASLNGLTDLCDRRLVGFTNDFCHTFAIEHDLARKELFQHFLDKTKQFLPYTHLCHINSLSLPYNGTDEHRGILPHDMSQPGVFPTRSELAELLRLYQHLPHDVYLVGEPMTDHVGNYQELVHLISQL